MNQENRNFYILKPDFDKFEYMVLFHEYGPEIKRSFNGQTIHDWTKIDVVIEKKRGYKKSDFPAFSYHIPIFSHKAITLMEDILSPHGQILPLACKKGEYYAFNVTTVLDALNEEQSEIVRFPDGRIMMINKYVIKDSEIADQSIFKLKKNELSKVIVNDLFVDLVREKDLSGFSFEKIRSV